MFLVFDTMKLKKYFRDKYFWYKYFHHTTKLLKSAFKPELPGMTGLVHAGGVASIALVFFVLELAFLPLRLLSDGLTQLCCPSGEASEHLL